LVIVVFKILLGFKSSVENGAVFVVASDSAIHGVLATHAVRPEVGLLFDLALLFVNEVAGNGGDHVVALFADLPPFVDFGLAVLALVDHFHHGHQTLLLRTLLLHCDVVISVPRVFSREQLPNVVAQHRLENAS